MSEADAKLARSLAPYLGSSPGEHGSGALLAVSGGPDSTALLHAAAMVGGAAPLYAMTVDHGLRSESAAEAEAVGVLAGRLGISHHIANWREDKPRSGVQAAARATRYRELEAIAARVGARWILTAHHADDQAETVLMRLLAGSGPRGLAGMAPERDAAVGSGVRLARPFLAIPKADLVAYCERHGLAYATDPSNENPSYLRTRLRRLLPLFEAEGLTTERIRRLAERLGRDDLALGEAADRLFVEARRASSDGMLRLDGNALQFAPAALVLRVVERALIEVRQMDGAAPILRLDRLERLVLDGLLPALAERRALRRTLLEVLVELSPDGEISLRPAPRRRRGMDAPLAEG